MVERVLALIDELKVRRKTVSSLSSFNHDWLRQVQAHESNLEIQAVLGYWADQPLDWGNLEFQTYNARHPLVDENQIRSLREKGIDVNLWTLERRGGYAAVHCRWRSRIYH